MKKKERYFTERARTEQATMSSSSNNDKHEEVVYEMFIPFLYRGKDKESTERRVFWVFKQLNWGYIWEVRVFGFEDTTKKNVTARISFSHINESAKELIDQLDAGDTAQVHYEQGKPWFWNVVKYTRRETKKPVEPQVTFKIKVKATGDKVKTTSTVRPSTPPSTTEFKPIVKPTSTDVKPAANKFKILPLEGDSPSSSESEEPK